MRLAVALPVAAVSLAVAGPVVAAPSGVVEGVAPLVGTDADAVIPDAYVVVLERGATAATRASVELAATLAGGTVRYTYTAALSGFSATLPARALEAVRVAPGVRYVEADTMSGLPAGELDTVGSEADPSSELVPRPIWNQDRLDQRALPLDDAFDLAGTGAGVTAYVIDTGTWFTHPEFEDRATSGYDFVDDDEDALDCNGHGTHVSGTLGGETYGMAPDVEIVAVRVLGCDGRGPKSQVIAGIDWVTADADGPSVANLSLGGQPSRAQDEALATSVRAGTTYAVAAGNDARNACKGSPARAPQALTVGATDSADAQWASSSFGRCLDLYAPGVAIRAAWPSDSGVTNTISGTSMAAPHVAAVAAVLLESDPGASSREVRRALVRQATRGELTDLGPRSPNRLLYGLVH